MLVAGPLYHVGAFDLPGVAVLWVGGMLYIHRDFEVERVLASVAVEKLTGGWLAPVMLGAILAHPRRAAFDVSSGMRWMIGGGERTPEARIRQFTGYFTRGRYIDAYGLTEIVQRRHVHGGGPRDREDRLGGARARPCGNRDSRSGRSAASAGEAGEICLRGPKITQGYWRDANKTAASFHGDWFRTGDVGYLDAEGFLYLTDRVKDMIISGGENIASSEVERVVYQLPQVREAAIIGVPDDEMGRASGRGGRAQRRAQPRLRNAGKTLPCASCRLQGAEGVDRTRPVAAQSFGQGAEAACSGMSCSGRRGRQCGPRGPRDRPGARAW